MSATGDNDTAFHIWPGAFQLAKNRGMEQVPFGGSNLFGSTSTLCSREIKYTLELQDFKWEKQIGLKMCKMENMKKHFHRSPPNLDWLNNKNSFNGNLMGLRMCTHNMLTLHIDWEGAREEEGLECRHRTPRLGTVKLLGDGLLPGDGGVGDLGAGLGEVHGEGAVHGAVRAGGQAVLLGHRSAAALPLRASVAQRARLPREGRRGCRRRGAVAVAAVIHDAVVRDAGLQGQAVRVRLAVRVRCAGEVACHNRQIGLLQLRNFILLHCEQRKQPQDSSTQTGKKTAKSKSL